VLASNPQYATAETWQPWMKDFRFGTLVFIPSGELRKVADRHREELDFISAQTSSAHITLTQPFAVAPTPEQLAQIETLIQAHAGFEVQVGPATTSPNKKLLWLDVLPKENVLALREGLHETGLFRTDLPLTKGFIPHLTLSEHPRAPEEVQSLIRIFNSKHRPWKVPFSSVVLIIPDTDFVFQEFRTFSLKV
jgi:2'-5' RNA ligase